jgi:hypothetical protein
VQTGFGEYGEHVGGDYDRKQAGNEALRAPKLQRSFGFEILLLARKDERRTQGLRNEHQKTPRVEMKSQYRITKTRIRGHNVQKDMAYRNASSPQSHKDDQTEARTDSMRRESARSCREHNREKRNTTKHHAKSLHVTKRTRQFVFDELHKEPSKQHSAEHKNIKLREKNRNSSTQDLHVSEVQLEDVARVMLEKHSHAEQNRDDTYKPKPALATPKGEERNQTAKGQQRLYHGCAEYNERACDQRENESACCGLTVLV